MSAVENYRYPERLEVFFTAGAEYMHALRVNTPYCKAGEGRALFEGAEPQEGGGKKMRDPEGSPRFDFVSPLNKI